MRHTDQIRFTVEGFGAKPQVFVLPLSEGREVKNLLNRKAGTKIKEPSIPARSVFPVLDDAVLRPATMLRGGRYRENMTQKQLAAALDIRQHHLSEMEHGKRPIGKDMAKRLGSILRCDYRVFL